MHHYSVDATYLAIWGLPDTISVPGSIDVHAKLQRALNFLSLLQPLQHRWQAAQAIKQGSALRVGLDVNRLLLPMLRTKRLRSLQ